MCRSKYFDKSHPTLMRLDIYKSKAGGSALDAIFNLCLKGASQDEITKLSPTNNGADH